MTTLPSAPGKYLPLKADDNLVGPGAFSVLDSFDKVNDDFELLSKIEHNFLTFPLKKVVPKEVDPAVEMARFLIEPLRLQLCNRGFLVISCMDVECMLKDLPTDLDFVALSMSPSWLMVL
ncbi:hypothetical protein LIER_01962 [Lithospermum erythrorhizon]|uniref:Uncharacterized protein n=1 Tax=Lithospermum erythrorhizon TaxID=34254 RepID=A0AAV3NMV3_LITER